MAKISKIKTSYGSDNPVRPVLVDFQNGVINAGQEKNLECGLFEDKSSKYCAVSNGKLTYAGAVDSDDLYTNFILVHNKKKNKIKLIQVDHCTLAPIFNKKEQLHDVVVTNEAMNTLNKTFGSKRAKRQTEQKERLKMNMESVKDDLERTVTDIKVDESLLANSTDSSNQISEIYPKINRQASSLEQVYNMDDLVPSDVLESLEEEAAQILESDLKEVEGLSKFVATHISQLQSSGGSPELKLRKCCIFLYINYIIKLVVTPLRHLTKNAVICPSSAKADEYLKATFLTAGKAGWHRPLSMKDKSLCHALVLAVLACGYAVNVEPLATDVKVSLRKTTEVARVLAFVTDKGNVRLRLPLPDAVSANKKRRRTM